MHAAAQDYDDAEAATTKGNFSELHSDYYASAGFVISAVLYLGEKQNAPSLIGGETAFVDIPPRVCSLAHPHDQS